MRAAVLIFILISSLNASAQIQVQQLKSKKPGLYTVETKYPRFRETTTLTRFANSMILDWVKHDQEEYITAVTDEDSIELRKVLVNPDWDYQAECRATMLRPKNLISVLCHIFQYSGGAHPIAYYQVFNFGILAGKERALTLSNFFLHGVVPTEEIRKVITRKLKTQRRNSLNGLSVDLKDTELDNFVVERDGITFVFDQCQITACVAGELEAKLTIQDLGPEFKKDLLKK